MTPIKALTLAGVPESLHSEAIASLNTAKTCLVQAALASCMQQGRCALS